MIFWWIGLRRAYVQVQDHANLLGQTPVQDQMW